MARQLGQSISKTGLVRCSQFVVVSIWFNPTCHGRQNHYKIPPCYDGSFANSPTPPFQNHLFHPPPLIGSWTKAPIDFHPCTNTPRPPTSHR